MGLHFCCPSCGAGLTVDPAAARLIGCPDCGEAIRVPLRSHPVEDIPATETFSPRALRDAERGLQFLRFSLPFFLIALTLALISFAIRLLSGVRAADEAPEWFSTTVTQLAMLWNSLTFFGCWLRHWGYRECTPAARAVGLTGWIAASRIGTIGSAIGSIAMGFCLIGRPTLVMPAEMIGMVVFGLVVGIVGIALEFAFLAFLYRLLWERAGWQMANRPGQYAVTFVFTVVAAIGVLGLGAMMAVALSGVQAIVDPAMKIVGIAVLVGLAISLGWGAFRYAQLLRIARQCLREPSRLSTGQTVPGK